ncbi:MAG: DNA polymerase IV [Acidobacteria bacterium]|nr:DNA polymerase IV [Acidobacteriota bacterium]
MDRRILHIDMDAFYASVEQRDDASLRGKPVAVGGPPDQRGVVAAASYEARIFGVHSAMPMATAVRLCPALVIVAPDFQKYRTVSKVIFDIFRSVTPLVEPLSMDEAYLDVTENAWGEALGVTVAKRIKQEIRDRTELTASAGVAPNKFLAKIASGWKKPNGLTVIAPDRIESFLQELPIDAFWGVGPKTARKLRALGLQKVVDVRAVDLELLRGAVGSLAEWLKRLADGHDDRAVEPDRPAKSASTENTYATDIRDLQTIRAEIAEMAQHSARWLERTQRLCRTVTIKVRYGNFTTITRSHSTKVPTRSADELVRRALHLLDRTEAGRLPVRLLGVGVTGLTEEGESGTMDKLF